MSDTPQKSPCAESAGLQSRDKPAVLQHFHLAPLPAPLKAALLERRLDKQRRPHAAKHYGKLCRCYGAVKRWKCSETAPPGAGIMDHKNGSLTGER